MQAARAGRPRVVLVEGEAGIGKSSLLSRFVSGHRDVCVLRASGEETETLLPWGVADQLLAAARTAAADGSPQARVTQRKCADPLPAAQLRSRNFTGERRPDSPSPAGGHRSRLRRGGYRARGRASPVIYSLGMAGALLLAFFRDAEGVPCPRC
jgi:hypothetical protein